MSELNSKMWAVVTYTGTVGRDLTYADALARDWEAQHGFAATVVTNAAADRLK